MNFTLALPLSAYSYLYLSSRKLAHNLQKSGSQHWQVKDLSIDSEDIEISKVLHLSREILIRI